MYYLWYSPKERVFQLGLDCVGIGSDDQKKEFASIVRTLHTGVQFRDWANPEFIAFCERPEVQDGVALFVQLALDVDTPRLGFPLQGSLKRRSRDELMTALEQIKAPERWASPLRSLAYFSLCVTLLKHKTLSVKWNANRRTSVDDTGMWLTVSESLGDGAGSSGDKTPGAKLFDLSWTDYTVAEGPPPDWVEFTAIAASDVQFTWDSQVLLWQNIWDSVTDGQPSTRAVMTRATSTFAHLVRVLHSAGQSVVPLELIPPIAFAMLEPPNQMVVQNMRDSLRTSVQTHVLQDIGSCVHHRAPPTPAELSTILPSRAEQNTIVTYLENRKATLTAWGYVQVPITPDSLKGISIEAARFTDGASRHRALALFRSTTLIKPKLTDIVLLQAAGPSGEVTISPTPDIVYNEQYMAMAECMTIDHFRHMYLMITRALVAHPANYYLFSDLGDTLLHAYAISLSSRLRYVYKQQIGYVFEVRVDTLTEQDLASEEIRALYGVNVDTAQAVPLVMKDARDAIILSMRAVGASNGFPAPAPAESFVRPTAVPTRIEPHRFDTVRPAARVPIGTPGYDGAPPAVSYVTITVLDAIADSNVRRAPLGDYYIEQHSRLKASCYAAAYLVAYSYTLGRSVEDIDNYGAGLMAHRMRRLAVLGFSLRLREAQRTGRPMPVTWNKSSGFAKVMQHSAQHGYWVLVASKSFASYYPMLCPQATPMHHYHITDMQRVAEGLGATPLQLHEMLLKFEAGKVEGI